MADQKRKLLILGGTFSQIPAIQYAKSAGYHVITCDYLPDNPGHQYSDEYYNVSTTDQEKVLELARMLKIDGILAYASDPAALTAAYVCDAMDLPGASYDSVLILSRKDIFRKFQEENGFFGVPHLVVKSAEEAGKLDGWDLPLVVKPVDSSGSKGVSVVRVRSMLKEAINQALDYSRCGLVIIEDFVDTPYPQHHGDGFVYKGELVFTGLCEHLFIGLVPVSSIYPSTLSKDLLEAVDNEVQRMLKAVGFTCGAINIEVRVRVDGRIVIMEIGGRSGGNYMPQLMECATGFNEVKAIVDLAMGEEVQVNLSEEKIPCLLYGLNTAEAGSFDGIALGQEERELLEYEYIHKKKGDWVDSYKNSSHSAGVLITRYKNREDIEYLLDRFSKCIQIKR